jgi:hypothetical protein
MERKVTFLCLYMGKNIHDIFKGPYFGSQGLFLRAVIRIKNGKNAGPGGRHKK